MKLSQVYKPLSFVRCPDMSLVDMVKDMNDEVENGYMDLDPVFQRGHVWTERQQELFMGHLLSGGVVQPLIISILGNRDIGKQILVDGKQRFCAISRFVSGEIFAEISDGTRFKFEDIEDWRVYSNRISVKVGFVHLSSDEATAWKETLKLYIKLNSGGTPHDDSEIERVKGLLS